MGHPLLLLTTISKVYKNVHYILVISLHMVPFQPYSVIKTVGWSYFCIFSRDDKITPPLPPL